MSTLIGKWNTLLRWSERYTQTDMVYLAHGGLWLIAGKGSIFFIYLLLMLAFANWLPQQTYGLYQYAIAAMGILAVFALPGINVALVTSIAQKKEGTLFRAIQTKLKWSLLGTVGMLLGAGWYFSHDQTAIATAFMLGGVFLPSYTTFSLFEAYWNGKKNFAKKSTYEVLTALSVAAVTIPVLFYTDNVLVVLITFLGTHAFTQGFFLWRTIQQSENKEEDRRGITFGKNLSVITAISIFAEHIDKVLLWKFLGPIQLAIYSFSLLPLQKMLSLNPITPLAQPRLSERNEEDVQRNLPKKFLKSFALTLPLAFSLVLIAPFAYESFFPQYVPSIIYFQAFTLLIAFAPFALIKTSLISQMRQKELYITSITRSALKIGLYLVFIPLFGIWGAVFGNLLGEIAGNALMLYFFMKFLPQKSS